MGWLNNLKKGIGSLAGRYTDGDNINWGNVGKDALVASTAYAALNPNDSETLGNFMGTNQQRPVGYMGGIPNYTASRELVPNAFAQTYTDPTTQEVTARRPGSAGRQYFTDTTFTQSTGEPTMGRTAEDIASDNQEALDNQALMESLMGNAYDTRVANASGSSGSSESSESSDSNAFQLPDVSPTGQYGSEDMQTVLRGLEDGSTDMEALSEWYDVPTLDIAENLILGGYKDPAQTAALSGISEEELIVQLLRAEKTNFDEVAAYYQDRFPGITAAQIEANYNNTEFAQGGNVNGYYLGGTTDGMADQIPATIDNSQPAALSDGEFVIPADIVSHLGNGNSEAGADNLYSMMERVRTDRTGNPNQGRQIDPNKYLA